MNTECQEKRDPYLTPAFFNGKNTALVKSAYRQ